MHSPSRKLRVLHTEASVGWGGQEIRILDESAGLIARGHDVHVAAAPEAPIVQTARKRGIPVHMVPLNLRRPGSLLALRKLLKDMKPDVIVTHSSSDSWLVALAVKTGAGKIPVVRTRHLSTPVHSWVSNRWLYGKVPSRVVTTGEAIRSHLIETLGLNPGFVVSVPTGADMSRYQPGDRMAARAGLGIGHKGPLIGIVATLRSWKGHRFIVSAMKDARLAPVHLLLIGDGPQMPMLRQQVQELRLENKITFTGQQSDVLPWLQSLDVFLFPSTGHEGVPQALVQAMACGLPVITTPVGAIPEVVTGGKTGWVIKPESADAIADAVVEILGDPAKAALLSENGRRHVMANFSMTAMLDTMESILLDATK